MDEEDEEEDQWLSKTPRLASLSQVFELCDLSLLFRQIMPLLIHGRKGFLLFSFFSFFFFFFFAPVVDIDLFDSQRNVFPVGHYFKDILKS
jgi:hypothetical protein